MAIERTFLIFLTVLTMLCMCAAAACSQRDAWRHQTLRGVQADHQWTVDDRECEERTPDPLPPAIYVAHGQGYIYESHDGPAQGAGSQSQRGEQLSGSSSAGAGGAAETTANVTATKTALGRVEYGIANAMYDRCMNVRGWQHDRAVDTSRQPPDERLPPQTTP